MAGEDQRCVACRKDVSAFIAPVFNVSALKSEM